MADIEYTGVYVTTVTFGPDVDAAQAEIVFSDGNGDEVATTLMVYDSYAAPVLSIATAALVAKASVTVWVNGQYDSEHRTYLTRLRLDISGLPSH